jgi:Fe-S cluster assembly protein SufB
VEEAFNQLGVPVREGREVAVDAIFDSVSVATTYRKSWRSRGLSSVRLARRSTIIPELVKNISAPWCRAMTTSLPR